MSKTRFVEINSPLEKGVLSLAARLVALSHGTDASADRAGSDFGSKTPPRPPTRARLTNKDKDSLSGTPPRG